MSKNLDQRIAEAKDNIYFIERISDALNPVLDQLEATAAFNGQPLILEVRRRVNAALTDALSASVCNHDDPIMSDIS